MDSISHIFSNSEAINVVNLSYKIIDLFVEGSKEQKAKENKYSHSLDELNRYAGHYQELNSDLGMKILIEGNVLKAKSSFGRIPIPLKEIGKNKFHRVQNLSVGRFVLFYLLKTHKLSQYSFQESYL